MLLAVPGASFELRLAGEPCAAFLRLAHDIIIIIIITSHRVDSTTLTRQETTVNMTIPYPVFFHALFAFFLNRWTGNADESLFIRDQIFVFLAAETIDETSPHDE